MPSTSKLLRKRIDEEVAADTTGTDPNWRDRFRMENPEKLAERPILHIRCSPQFRAALDVAVARSPETTMTEFVQVAIGARMVELLDVNLSDFPEFEPEQITFQR